MGWCAIICEAPPLLIHICSQFFHFPCVNTWISSHSHVLNRYLGEGLLDYRVPVVFPSLSSLFSFRQYLDVTKESWNLELAKQSRLALNYCCLPLPSEVLWWQVTLFVFCCGLLKRVSHSLGLPWAHYIGKDSLKLLIILPLPSKFWDYRHGSPYVAKMSWVFIMVS